MGEGLARVVLPVASENDARDAALPHVADAGGPTTLEERR